MVDKLYLELIKHLVLIGEIVEMRYAGSSMLPIIPKACRIIVSKANELKPGNIYVYVAEGAYSVMVCHELVSILDGLLLFRGYNRPCYDSPVKPAQVLGQCIGYVADCMFVPLVEGVVYDTIQHRVN